MRYRSLSPLLLALAAGVPAARAQQRIDPQRERAPVPAPVTLFALASDDFASGTLLEVRGDPPARVRTLAPTNGAERLRRFGPELWLIHPQAGTLERVSLAGGASEAFDLGPTSAPQDVHVVTGTRGRVAWVTRRHEPALLRIDLASGRRVDAVDLAPLGGGAPIALGTLERDGARLFVQVKVEGFAAEPDRGLLAVVDLATETLLDLDGTRPGVQGIELEGAPPQLPMQIVQETRSLFVSASEGTLDGRGAIERIGLDSLANQGPVLTEEQVGDLGAFVMTSPEGGYFVFHTDIVASTHLARFTIAGGPIFEGDLITMLGDAVDVLAWDRRHERLYIPTRFAWGDHGIHAFDTSTNELVPGSPILTGAVVHDVLVAR